MLTILTLQAAPRLLRMLLEYNGGVTESMLLTDLFRTQEPARPPLRTATQQLASVARVRYQSEHKRRRVCVSQAFACTKSSCGELRPGHSLQVTVRRVTALQPLSARSSAVPEAGNLYLDALAAGGDEEAGGVALLIALPLAWQFVAANHPGLFEGAVCLF